MRKLAKIINRELIYIWDENFTLEDKIETTTIDSSDMIRNGRVEILDMPVGYKI